jgi:hypothetical protein
MKRFLVPFLLLLALTLNAQNYAANIAALIDPAKLETLGKRGANSRVQKYVYWLEMARKSGESPENVAQSAVAKAGYKDAAAKLTTAELLRNLDIAGKLGCLDEAGMAKMRRGNAPLVTKGPYAGQIASIDHIVPRAVAPELDNCIANLELLPLRVNESKNDKIGDRQRDMANKFHAAGLLSIAGLKAVEAR